MIQAQSYATEIEHILCDIFSCKRWGFGGIVNSDFIRKYPYMALVAGLAYVSVNATVEQQAKIEEYIESNYDYAGWSIDIILSFDTNKKGMNGIEYKIPYTNGKELLENMIKEYKEIAQSSN